MKVKIVEDPNARTRVGRRDTEEDDHGDAEETLRSGWAPPR